MLQKLRRKRLNLENKNNVFGNIYEEMDIGRAAGSLLFFLLSTLLPLRGFFWFLSLLFSLFLHLHLTALILTIQGKIGTLTALLLDVHEEVRLSLSNAMGNNSPRVLMTYSLFLSSM